MATPVTLKVFRGDELVRTEHFTRDIIKIGRLSSAHLCLEDERISRLPPDDVGPRHAENLGTHRGKRWPACTIIRLP